MGAEKVYRTSDVFGMSRDIPLNYQERKSADTVLLDSLTRDKHLVIYGSSKQGKTCLRKHCLQEDDYIVVHCSNKWTLHDLHSAILKESGFEVTRSSTKTSSGKSKIFAKVKANIFVGSGEGGGEHENSKEDSQTTAPLELDAEDVNDVIRALSQVGFNKFVVLEDFHYLPIETQKDFAVALKAFHENSDLCFIIVGVWLEENRLTVYNGDLTGRILPIDADKWTVEELGKVISTGEALLNIQIAPTFKAELLERCHKSVFIVQEACYLCCERQGVNKTASQLEKVGFDIDARDLVAEVVDKHTGRFNSFLTQFADGFQSTELQMYKWLLFPVLTATNQVLVKGIRQADIRKILQQVHPLGDDLNPGNVTQALLSVGNLQVKKEVKPIVLDYDQTNLRLNVVDRSFLIWLENQDRLELLEFVGLPSESTLSDSSEDLFH